MGSCKKKLRRGFLCRSSAKDAIAEAQKRAPVISFAKERILRASNRRPLIVQGSVRYTGGGNVVATVKVAGNLDDVQQVMDDAWTGKCGFRQSPKVTQAILPPKIRNAEAATKAIQDCEASCQKLETLTQWIKTPVPPAPPSRNVMATVKSDGHMASLENDGQTYTVQDFVGCVGQNCGHVEKASAHSSHALSATSKDIERLEKEMAEMARKASVHASRTPPVVD